MSKEMQGGEIELLGISIFEQPCSQKWSNATVKNPARERSYKRFHSQSESQGGA